MQRNQQQLARAGILFAPVTPQGLTHFNADACSDAPLRTPLLIDYMGHNALAYRMIAEAQPGFIFPPVHTPAHDPMPDAATVFAQIKNLADVMSARDLVFCSEDLARASLMVPTVPTRFAKHFGISDVVLIATLRRPDDAIATWQTQRLRFGIPFAPLHTDPPEAWLGTVHFEYQAALEPWLQAFPNATLRLQSYTQLRAQGGSVESFGALSQLDLPEGLAPIPDSNSSLPYALLEIARQSLTALPHQSARKFLTYLEGAAGRLDLLPTPESNCLPPRRAAHCTVPLQTFIYGFPKPQAAGRSLRTSMRCTLRKSRNKSCQT